MDREKSGKELVRYNLGVGGSRFPLGASCCSEPDEYIAESADTGLSSHNLLYGFELNPN